MNYWSQENYDAMIAEIERNVEESRKEYEKYNRRFLWVASIYWSIILTGLTLISIYLFN